MKFRATEGRSYPTLGITVKAGDVVELPEDTNVAGLIKIEVESSKKPAPVKESE